MTDQTKHTPGPWKIVEHGRAVYVSVYRPLCLPRETGWAEFPVQPYSHPQEARANARLIAAAPDLLREAKHADQMIAQLCDMVNTYSEKLGLGRKVRAEDWAEELRAAIAKAEGEA